MSKLAITIKQINSDPHDANIFKLKHFFMSNFPKTSQALQILDDEYMKPKRRKGFNLLPRRSIKNGIIYYARFSYKGKMLPTKFNTHTGDLREAEQYALKNKEILIERYLAKKDGRLFKFLSEFYKKESIIPEVTVLKDGIRKEYESTISKYFIPFLQSEKIVDFHQIKKITLTKYQDKALSGEIKLLTNEKAEISSIKPQTVANYMKPVKKIFAYLARKGELTDNVAAEVKHLPVHTGDVLSRGCYEIDLLKGVFNRRWKDDLSCLLCAIIYTTGMRNSEIMKINLTKDIIKIGNCRFINIESSKTNNGVRKVPLHDFVYKKMVSWTKKNNKTNLLFNDCNDETFKNANINLSKMLKISSEQLKEEKITFYSGRHFYKTLLNAEGLGENIEEIFMGHKVTTNVRQSYNHRDKQGKERLLKKARQALSILDRCIFTNKAGRCTSPGRRGRGGAALVLKK